VAEICREFNLTASAEFEEPSCDIYGSCEYKSDGTFKESVISEYFFQEVEFNCDTDMYDYRGGEWSYVDDLIQDEYLTWVKEWVTGADKDSAEVLMQISDSWIERAVGSHENAEGIVRLLTSEDKQNVELGITLYNSIVKCPAD
jgi:hypothetical protein